jgi:hypothetical protein
VVHPHHYIALYGSQPHGSVLVKSMGHYDLNRDGPSKTEIRLRRQAYESKQGKLLRDDIDDTEIRSYLVELQECPDDGRYAPCMSEHVTDVIYDDDDFAAAEQLVDRGIYDEVYDVLPETDRGRQLREMCYDEGWVRRQMGGHPLTDDGIEVMLDGAIERTNDPTWDDNRARQWHKHD